MPIPWFQAFVDAAHARLMALPGVHPARAYLRQRGVDDRFVTEYRLGWVPQPEIAATTPEFWEWLRRWGWDRLAFPLTDPFGSAIGVQLRSLDRKGYAEFLAQPKELCPPAFGLHTALPTAFTTGRLVIVEGVFDFLAVRAWTPAALAILTNTPSLGLRRLFSRYATHVTALLDMDAAGRRGAHRLAGLAVPSEYAKPTDRVARLTPPTYRVSIPAYTEHDPDDLRAAGKSAELQRLVALR